MGTGGICHTALIPGAGQIFHPLLESGVFAKAKILIKKPNQTPHLSTLDLLGGFSWKKTRTTLQK